MIKYAPYSFSKVSVHKQCPRKFRYKYLDKIKIKHTPQLHLERGLLLHLFMEHGIDYDKYKDDWQYQKCKLLTTEVKGECEDIYNNFISSETGKWHKSLKTLFNELPIALDNKLQPAEFDHDYGRGEKDNLFQGFIDNVSVLEEKDLCVITDWKSGKISEKIKWDQLLYYAIYMFSVIPQDNILLVLSYLEHKEKRFQLLKREDLNKYKKALINEIKNVENDNDFNKNVTGLCKYCDYEDICDPQTP